MALKNFILCAFLFSSLMGTDLVASQSNEAPQEQIPQASAPQEHSAPAGTFKSEVTLGALDKVTARLSHLKATVDKPIKFGSLTLTVKRCWQSDPEDTPETKVFLEIQDQKPYHEPEIVFKGWMFASNHSISSLEHPVYDVWVLGSGGASLKPQDDPNAHAPSAESLQKFDNLLDNLFEKTAEEDVVD